MEVANLFPVDKRILVLHAHKFGPPIPTRHFIQKSKLPTSHRTSTDIAHFAADDQVMQSFHYLLRRYFVIKTMNLKKVDVGTLKAGKRCINRIEDSSSRKTRLVDIFALITQSRC